MNQIVIAAISCGAAVIVACAEPPTGEAMNASGGQVVVPTAAPEAGTTVRVGGDVGATIKGKDGDYQAGSSSIDTPLPTGYPAPTPPGAIDLKTYPSVRRAAVKGKGTPDSGMNGTFWPLFNHIKKHEIAMTSPVEMDYRGMSGDKGSAPKEWSMAFLYRTAELNGTGEEGSVVVSDAAPVTVVAVGMKGDYSMKLVNEGIEKIEAWLAANRGWVAAGDWRSLYYNGPQLFWWNKWAEVQIPVKRVEAAK